MEERPELDMLPDVVRRLSARVAQLEDAVSVYGPPPRRLPIPELTAEQKKTLFILVVVLALAALPIARRDRS